jgi:hypothetical protein
MFGEASRRGEGVELAERLLLDRDELPDLFAEPKALGGTALEASDHGSR